MPTALYVRRTDQNTYVVSSLYGDKHSGNYKYTDTDRSPAVWERAIRNACEKLCIRGPVFSCGGGLYVVIPEGSEAKYTVD